MTPAATTDRAAALRAAVRTVVAGRGLHGASMSAIAAEAGVATGTAYVHYADKDDLVLAAYVEAKHDLGAAAVAGAAGALDGPDRAAAFRAVWLAAHRHLRAHPADAAFLVQIDASPLWATAHRRVLEQGDDPLRAAIDDGGLRSALADLPDEVLYELGLAPAVRLAARAAILDDDQLARTADACWAAVT